MKRKRALFKKQFLVATLSCLILVLPFAGYAATVVNLEVPIEMVDYGLNSFTSGRVFDRSAVYLDTDDYDNATYYFEVVAKNVGSSEKYIRLKHLPSTDTVAEVPIAGGTSAYTRIRTMSPWQPLEGKHIYVVRTPATSAAQDIIVQAARIIVKQTNATKTRIQIPLVQRKYSGSGGKTADVDTTTEYTAYTQGDADNYSLWENKADNYATLSGGTPWTLEAVLNNSTVAGTTYVALFNAGTGAQVTGSEISHTGTTLTLVEGSFASFADGEYEVRIKSTNGNTAELCSGARLYVRLTDLSKGEVLYRVAREFPTLSGTHIVEQRIVLDTGLFTGPSVYFEATGRCWWDQERVSLRDAGTNDSGTSSSAVSGSGISFNSTEKIRKRTSAISPDEGDRFYTYAYDTQLTHAWVVVKFAEVNIQPSDHYVNEENPTPAEPYNDWPIAATDIQDAIEYCEATSGAGTIYVRKISGPYYRVNDPTFVLKSNIHLIGCKEDGTPTSPTDPRDGPTIDGRGSLTPDRRCVVFDGPISNCTVEGFTFTGGSPEGKIHMNGTGSPVTGITIKDCYFHDDTGVGDVGIRYQGAVAFSVIDCEFDNLTSAISDVPHHGPVPLSNTGLPIIIQGCHIHDCSYGGIRLVGDGGGGFEMDIGGANGNQIYNIGKGGIYLSGLGANCDVTIDNNEIYGNGWDFGPAPPDDSGQFGGMRIHEVSGGGGSSGVVIQRNSIHDNHMGGICVSGTSDVTIGADLADSNPFDYGNEIYGNLGGVSTACYGGDKMVGDLVIRGNHIYGNGGTSEGGGIWLQRAVEGTATISQNNIALNRMGGIGIRKAPLSGNCTLEISKNDIHHNIERGGIHTGDQDGDFVNPGNFTAASTIKQNKVHHNLNANYGGGIDVRHFRGTIKNNLVYRNSRGGLRYGDRAEGIFHNTVTHNGNNYDTADSSDDRGGGIVYDDDEGLVNDPPSGAPSESFPIKNNISAYSVRAGLRACFYETEDIGGNKYRDYNLLYSNNQDFLLDWCGTFCASPDCSAGDSRDQKKCRGAQLGRGCDGETTFCCSAIGATGPLPGETLIFADPQFESIVEGSEDYRLKDTSPAKGAGDCDGSPCDMGAYGGPDAMDDNDFLSASYEDCLIDGDTTTGNSPGGGRRLFFDLGGTYTVKHVRLYGSERYSHSWSIYIADTSDGCPDGHQACYVCWSVGGASQWYEYDVADYEGSYIQIVSNGNINRDTVFEFQFSNVDTPTGDGDWLSPVSVVDACSNIYGKCKE